MVRARMLAGATLAALAVSACSLPLPGGDEDTDLGTGDDYSVAGALTQLPAATDGHLQVWTADLASASELAGVERPSEPEADTVLQWLQPLIRVPGPGHPDEDGVRSDLVHALPPEVTQPTTLARVAEFDELAGWSIVDIDSYAELQQTPAVFSVLTGDFDESTLSDLPEVRDGVRTVGEGEDLHMDLAGATAVDPMGRPLRLAESDGRLVASRSTDSVAAWLSGPDETLADDPALASLAEALDDAEVVSAVLVAGQDFGVGTTARGVRLPEEPDELPDKPFDAVAVGWSVVDDASRVVLAYHFADDDAAEASVAPIRQVLAEGRDQYGNALSEQLTVVDVTSDGSVVTATVDPVDARATHTIADRLVQRDLPFVHD